MAAEGDALEDLGRGRPSDDDWARAGAALAALHARRGGAFGFGCDGFVGDTPQDNRPEADGFRFFAERRLQPLTRRARDLGMLDANQTGRIDRLCARLADWLPESPAVLVHGDLWLGNLHACTNGELALIDAGAVHYGWAAGDLAMLTLFAAPPPSLFAAYEAQGGIADWRASSPLLNLYPLLNHLCLFGAGYRASVQAVLDRYG